MFWHTSREIRMNDVIDIILVIIVGIVVVQCWITLLLVDAAGHWLSWFVSERSKAEGKAVQNLKSSELLKEERKETEKLRALVDRWLVAEKKLNFLSEELVRCDFLNNFQVFGYTIWFRITSWHLIAVLAILNFIFKCIKLLCHSYNWHFCTFILTLWRVVYIQAKMFSFWAFYLCCNQRSVELMSWLCEQLLSVVRHHRRRLLLKLFLLCQDKSGWDETWYEWYEGKRLQRYRVDAEYLHKLCYQVKGTHKTQQSYFSRGALVWKLMPLKRWRNFSGGHIIRCLVDKFKMVTGTVNMFIWSVCGARRGLLIESHGNIPDWLQDIL